MPESSQGSDDGKLFGPQDQGITRTFPEKLKSGQAVDDLRDRLDNTNIGRRSLIKAGVASGLAVAAAITGRKLRQEDHEASPGQLSPTPEVEAVHPPLTLLARDENGELGFSKSPNVAQYIENPDFKGIGTNLTVKIRNEIDVTNDENIVGEINAHELNDLGIGLIRVGGKGYMANNDLHDDPQYTFGTTDKDHVPVFEYEWLAFAKKIEPDPNNPDLYIDESDDSLSIQLVDKDGNPVDKNNYQVISPIYVNTTGN